MGFVLQSRGGRRAASLVSSRNALLLYGRLDRSFLNRSFLQSRGGRRAAALVCQAHRRPRGQPGGGAAAQVRAAPHRQAQVGLHVENKGNVGCKKEIRATLAARMAVATCRSGGISAGCTAPSGRRWVEGARRQVSGALHSWMHSHTTPLAAARSGWRAAGAAAQASSLTRPRTPSVACCRWVAFVWCLSETPKPWQGQACGRGVASHACSVPDAWQAMHSAPSWAQLSMCSAGRRGTTRLLPNQQAPPHFE